MPQYEVVYTSDPQDCPRCHRTPCACPRPKAAASPPPSKLTAKLRLERGGRKGKTVTVVFNLALPAERLRELLKEAQKACGTGGTVRPDGFELQGDHRDRLEAHLKSLGMAVKRAGG